MRLCSPAHPTRAFLNRLSLALVIVVLTLTGAAPRVAAWQTAPPSLPVPPPPPADPPEGFTSTEIERARIHVEPGAEIDAAAFARSWGLLIDDGLDQLESFLPPLADKIDVYVYVSEASYATATATARWREPEATDVLANPGRGDIAVNAIAFARRTPLEAENALRHAMSHVAAREASAGRIPRGFDEGLAAYFERPVAARLARHAALVQNARAGGDLMSWSDLNRPAAPDTPPPVLIAHAYSMVAFLIDRHGPRVLGDFIAALADEPDWRAVLRTTYSRAPNELEAQWEESLPRWTTGGWRTNLLAAFDLQPARDLLELGHYATARRELEQSLRLFTDLGDDEGIAEVGTLLTQTDTGLQAETFMSQAQAALELHDYDRAQTLLQQARVQYDRLSTAQEPTELLAAYGELAQAGVQAARDLESARQLSLRWADYPMSRASALAAGTGYARLGDDAGRSQTVEVLEALDSRQRRLVLLFGGLALLSAAWLTLWLWARGGTQLDWER
jgi:tetratricopeptide (TPR) repeat protein